MHGHIKLQENDNIRYFEERRTGRTTRMLKAALKSKKGIVFIIAPTLQIAKLCIIPMFLYQLDMNNVDYTFVKSKLQVKVGNKTFVFTNEESLNDTSYYKGLNDYDIYRDHTCYELDN